MNDMLSHSFGIGLEIACTATDVGTFTYEGYTIDFRVL